MRNCGNQALEEIRHMPYNRGSEDSWETVAYRMHAKAKNNLTKNKNEM